VNTWEISSTIIAETIATLIGIFVGTLAALTADRRNERRRKQRRARVVLRSLSQELSESYHTLQTARSAYLRTPWGQSFYISTIAWETAMAGGDLPDIIGFELTDAISAQYALLVRIRYYVDLLTQLWFAPDEIQGYEEIRRGFHRAILEAMNQAINRHPNVIKQIKSATNR
jgi:uncharacterized membrane protein YccC